MSKGFMGLPGDMQALMKQAQQMREQLQKVQAEVQALTAEGSAGGGMVRVKVNGRNEVLAVTIDPQVVNPADVEMLQDLVRAAANEGLRKVQEDVKTKLAGVTGGLDLANLF